MSMVKNEDFKLLKGSYLSQYKFHTKVATHYGKICIYTHHNPRSNSMMTGFNLVA